MRLMRKMPAGSQPPHDLWLASNKVFDPDSTTVSLVLCRVVVDNPTTAAIIAPIREGSVATRNLATKLLGDHHATSRAEIFETHFHRSDWHVDRGGHPHRPVHDDRQQGPAHQRAERAAKLADDERGLRLHPVFEAYSDQPGQRQEPSDGLGHGPWGYAGRRAERSGKRSESAHRQRHDVRDGWLGHAL